MIRTMLLAGTAAALLFTASEAPAQTRLRLLDAGAEPRQLLRYRFSPDHRERVRVEVRMQMALSFAGQSMPPASLPGMRMNMELQSTEVAADGSARISFVLSSAEVFGDGPQIGQLNQRLSAVSGISGWYRMDTLGNVLETHVERGAAADPLNAAVLRDLEQSLKRINLLLPEQPVGIGARWQVTQELENNGVKMSQTGEFRLRSRSGDRLELDVQLVDGRISDVSTLPPGAKIESVTVKGDGTSSLRLDGLTPTASIDADIDLGLSITAEGQTMPMGMSMKATHTVMAED
jgi:hypothetical protein